MGMTERAGSLLNKWWGRADQRGIEMVAPMFGRDALSE